MGCGSRYDSAIKTLHGEPTVVTAEDIKVGPMISEEALTEMEKAGIKFTREKIVFTAKLENGRYAFLETGNSKSGLQHIKEVHGQDFMNAFGIEEDQIGIFLSEAISKGRLITSYRHDSDGKEGYRRVYYLLGDYAVVFALASNGYITTAFPQNLRDYVKYTKGSNDE